MLTVTNINQNLNKVLSDKFNKVMKIESTIHNIDTKNNFFLICDKSDTSSPMDTTIKCLTNLDISDLHINDNVILICVLKMNKNSTIYFDVEYLYTVSEEEKMTSRLTKYKTYKNIIISPKNKLKLDMIYNMKYPEIVNNIGLITIDNNNRASSQFKKEFTNLCNGKLYIYNMKKNKLMTELRFALEYFKKYHNIDLICIVVDKLSTYDVLNMASDENIKYMFRRKGFPYIISVSESHTNDKIVDMLSNKHIQTVTECINHIHTNQLIMINKVDDSITLGKSTLLEIVDNYKNMIIDLENKLNSQLHSLGANQQKLTTKHISDKLKTLLVIKIDDHISDLLKKKIFIANTLLEDDQTNNYFTDILTSTYGGLDIGFNSMGSPCRTSPTGFPCGLDAELGNINMFDVLTASNSVMNSKSHDDSLIDIIDKYNVSDIFVHKGIQDINSTEKSESVISNSDMIPQYMTENIDMSNSHKTLLDSSIFFSMISTDDIIFNNKSTLDNNDVIMS